MNPSPIQPDETIYLQGHGLVISEITSDQWVFGAQKLPEIVMQKDGNWKEFLVKFERQSYGFDTFACALYNVLQPIEILQKKITGKEYDWSERYPYIKLGIQPPGSNPHHNLEHIRKYGLIPEDMLPFTDIIRTLEEYADPKALTQAMHDAAFRFLQEWKLGHEWLWDKPSLSVKEKHERMKTALRYSPLGVSVVGWREHNGIYYKDEGEPDNHWCNVVAFDSDYPIVADSYEPFLKKLDKNYDFGFAKRYSVERLVTLPKPEKQAYFLELWLERLRALVKLYFPQTNL